MVIKSISHHSTKRKNIKQAFDYVFSKVRGLNDNDAPIIVKKNLKGMDVERWIDQVHANEQKSTYSYGNKKLVLRHELISFSPKDSKFLTRDILRDLMKEFLNKRSKSSLGVGAFHLEDDEDGEKCYHIHFLISNTSVIDGGSTSISQKDYEQFKIDFQELQKQRYPQLAHSIVDHKKKRKK